MALFSPESEAANASPAKRLEDLMHLAELCIDLLQQNDEHHAEVRAPGLVLTCDRALLFLPVRERFEAQTPLQSLTDGKE